ncbi:MAG: ABC transporter ATP-binding protein [Oscillospiraceae bacterium]|nr:ABC transporter ATP-binding protein [Oscillospiraceae bacterium]
MKTAIEIENLSKSYGNLKAVDNISFYVEQGSLFAFLGPNGAGKSTTISILNTFLKPDSGNVRIGGRVLGKDDSKIRSEIGAVFQESLLDPLLSVKDNLTFRGSFYGLRGKALKEAVSNAAEKTGVTEFLSRPYGKLSGGQRRRADIARALLNTPKILFLDEPTTGLDPQTRLAVWETVQKLQKESGITVFLTTHYLEEAENADYVVIMDGGKIAAKGTPVELKTEYVSDILRLYPINEKSGDLENLLKNYGIYFTESKDSLQIPIASTFSALPLIEQTREYVFDYEVHKGTMDSLFVAVTGKEIR